MVSESKPPHTPETPAHVRKTGGEQRLAGDGTAGDRRYDYWCLNRSPNSLKPLKPSTLSVSLNPSPPETLITPPEESGATEEDGGYDGKRKKRTSSSNNSGGRGDRIGK